MATKKPVRKPAPKAPAPALRRPDMAPINAVRNPNFELEMAQQNYANLMADQQARLAAQGGNFTQGRLMGAPSGQFGGLGGMTADQAGISPEQTRILNDLMARQASRGGLGGMTADQAGISAEQRRILDNLAASQNLGGGIATMTANQAGIPTDQRRILDDLMARDQVNFAANEAKRQEFMKTQKPVGGSIAGPIYGSLAGNVFADGRLVSSNKAKLDATKMQQYNQFLGQGMQNSNTLNQSAMPAGGMGMQQPRQAPAPRKFSIASNPSAKAF